MGVNVIFRNFLAFKDKKTAFYMCRCKSTHIWLRRFIVFVDSFSAADVRKEVFNRSKKQIFFVCFFYIGLGDNTI